MSGSTQQILGTNRSRNADVHSFEVTPVERDACTVDIRGHRVPVDQPLDAGATDTAPPPTGLFAASLATCIAFHTGRFLHRRGLAQAGLRVRTEFTMATDRPARVAVASHGTVHSALRQTPRIEIEPEP